MRVLLTGATGLVGRPVLDRLLHQGARVTVLAVADTVRKLPGHDALDVVTGDLQAPDRLAAAARGVEVVVHAAGALPGSSPAELERVNVEGTENLLLAAAEARVRRFVLLSSTAVYAPAPPRAWPVAEDHPLGPARPPSIAYGRSKIAAEGLVTRFRRRHHLECAILRPSTVYGAGAQRPLELVAELRDNPGAALRSPLAGVAMQWVHANDLADAVLAATAPGVGWAVCNVAGGELFDLRALARTVHGLDRRTGRLAAALLHAPALPSLPLRYDLNRAARLLGWRPTTRLRDGLAPLLNDEPAVRAQPPAAHV
ncbi:NAD-dependent epimerase/dehydratase family protein [Capillimicrobium parvum]|uniref:UDP-glucose 4-epimerase n=1 Tax=Capillimicrobium parvum TaxID=2884022 RepID=A0A9E7C0H5_9ACTN|nr:NAD(P)-dependent oxidoreductase [Capillimicrobium parvum]UGS36420.1 UDP-glucose 4-epimerase [Capillimicrobium parvum]